VRSVKDPVTGERNAETAAYKVEVAPRDSNAVVALAPEALETEAAREATAAQAAKAAEQRERILRSATLLYASRGYAATRVEDIAAHAKMSLRTLYAHFKNLADLRFAVYEEAIHRTIMRVAEVIGDPAIDDHLDAAMEAGFSICTEAPDLARVIVHEFQLDEPRNVARRKEILDFFVALIVEVTNQDHVAGRTPYAGDPVVVLAMLAMVEGLVVNVLNNPGPSYAESVRAAMTVAKRVYRSVLPWRPGVHATCDPSEFPRER
jgi:AcrR family transcriptional regulator